VQMSEDGFVTMVTGQPYIIFKSSFKSGLNQERPVESLKIQFHLNSTQTSNNNIEDLLLASLLLNNHKKNGSNIILTVNSQKLSNVKTLELNDLSEVIGFMNNSGIPFCDDQAKVPGNCFRFPKISKMALRSETMFSYFQSKSELTGFRIGSVFSKTYLEPEEAQCDIVFSEITFDQKETNIYEILRCKGSSQEDFHKKIKAQIGESNFGALDFNSSTLKLEYQQNGKVSSIRTSSNYLIPGCITRTLHENGFHRELKTIIEVTTLDPLNKFHNLEECKAIIEETISENVYIDKHQIQQGISFGGPAFSSLSEIDLEKPSSSSSQHHGQFTASLKIDSRTEHSIRFQPIKYPIHFRYQTPIMHENPFYSSDLSRPVEIFPPNVYIQCDNHSSSGKFEEVPFAPHQLNFPNSLSIINSLECKASNYPLMARVPVGNSGSLEFVTMATILATFLGTIYLIIVIFRSLNLRDRKRE